MNKISLVKTKLSKRITSIVLLFGILLIVAPTQLVDHHDHHVKICTEQENHFDVPSHECALCDFVIPAFIPITVSYSIQSPLVVSKYRFQYWESIHTSQKQHSFLRGPPSCFV